MLGLAVLRGTAGNLGAWTLPPGMEKKYLSITSE